MKPVSSLNVLIKIVPITFHPDESAVQDPSTVLHTDPLELPPFDVADVDKLPFELLLQSGWNTKLASFGVDVYWMTYLRKDVDPDCLTQQVGWKPLQPIPHQVQILQNPIWWLMVVINVQMVYEILQNQHP
jgi:hypothetical protein